MLTIVPFPDWPLLSGLPVPAMVWMTGSAANDAAGAKQAARTIRRGRSAAEEKLPLPRLIWAGVGSPASHDGQTATRGVSQRLLDSFAHIVSNCNLLELLWLRRIRSACVGGDSQ